MPSFWKGFGQEFGESFGDTFRQARADRLRREERDEDRAYREEQDKRQRERVAKAKRDRMIAAIGAATPEARKRYADTAQQPIPFAGTQREGVMQTALTQDTGVEAPPLWQQTPEWQAEQDAIRMDIAERQLGKAEADIGREAASDKAFEDFKKKLRFEKKELEGKDELAKVELIAASAADAGLEEWEMFSQLAGLGLDVESEKGSLMASQSWRNAKNKLEGMDERSLRAAFNKNAETYMDLYAQQASDQSKDISWGGFLAAHPGMGFGEVPSGQTIFETGALKKGLEREAHDLSVERKDEAHERVLKRAEEALVTSPEGRRLRAAFDKVIKRPEDPAGLQRVPMREGVAYDRKYQPLVDDGYMATEGGELYVTDKYIAEIADRGELVLDYIGFTGEFPSPAATKQDLQEGFAVALQNSTHVAGEADSKALDFDENPILGADKFINQLNIPDRQKRAAKATWARDYYLDLRNAEGKKDERLEAWKYLSQNAGTEGVPLAPDGTPRFIIMAEQATDKETGKWMIVPKLQIHPEFQGTISPDFFTALGQKLRDYQMKGIPPAMPGTVPFKDTKGNTQNAKITEVPDDLEIPSPNDVGVVRPADYDGDVNPSSSRLVKRAAERKYKKELRDSGQFTESEIQRKVEHLGIWLWGKK